VDTHGHTPRAAVIDQQGQLAGDQEFPADKRGSGGYRLLRWLSRHGQLEAIGWKASAARRRPDPATSWISTSPWWRSTGQAGAPAGSAASRTRSTLRPPPARCWPARPPRRPSDATVTNSNCAGVTYSQRIDIPQVLVWIRSFL
jgi:hypothetical protein